jgi:hypothetical protein
MTAPNIQQAHTLTLTEDERVNLAMEKAVTADHAHLLQSHGAGGFQKQQNDAGLGVGGMATPSGSGQSTGVSSSSKGGIALSTPSPGAPYTAPAGQPAVSGEAEE